MFINLLQFLFRGGNSIFKRVVTQAKELSHMSRLFILKAAAIATLLLALAGIVTMSHSAHACDVHNCPDHCSPYNSPFPECR